MEEGTARKPVLTDRVRSQRFRAGAVIVIAVILGLILWLALRGNDSSSKQNNASAATQAQLESLANSLKQPIFWVGPRPGNTYELMHQQNGNINVRYLPSGAKVGSTTPYLSVATYPFVNAYEALKAIKAKDVVFMKIPGGGIAEYSKTYPQSVHAAYPNVDYQIEVYDPSPGTATGLLVSGQLSHLGKIRKQGPEAASKPTAMSAKEIAALPRSLGHPVYWLGAEKGSTYSVIRSPNGNVSIRYLPHGVPLATTKTYPSVATYPFPNAYRSTKALTKNPTVRRLTVPNGGVAVYDTGYPQSIHVAYPSSDVQIEVYDPSAARARAAVTSGQLIRLG